MCNTALHDGTGAKLYIIYDTPVLHDDIITLGTLYGEIKYHLLGVYNGSLNG